MQFIRNIVIEDPNKNELIETSLVPNLVGEGAPSKNTAGIVGCQYMDSETGEVYKCTGSSVDGSIWEPFGGMNASNVPVGTQYKYATLTDAINAANNDAFDDYKEPSETKVGVLRYGPGNYRVDLLEDVTESIGIVITCNVYLSLNGNTLSFTSPGSGLIYSEGIYCVIDGRVVGSAIDKTVTSSGKEQLIDTLAKSLKLLGGSYTISSTGTVYAIKSASDYPDGYDEMTDDEKREWLICNKSHLPSIEIDGCNIKSTGGSVNADMFLICARVEAKNSTIEASNAGHIRCVYVDLSYGNFTNCTILDNCDKGGLQYLFYLANCSQVFFNNCLLNMNISGKLQDIYGIRGASNTIIDVTKCNISINYSGTTIKYICGGISSSYCTYIRDTKVLVNTPCTSKIAGVKFSEQDDHVTLINCDIEAVYASIITHEGGRVCHAVDCNLIGYIYGAVEHTSDAKIYLKDCKIVGGLHSGDYSEQLSTVTPSSCAILAGISKFDSCTINVGEKASNIFAVDLSTDMSNCTINRAGNQLIKLRKSTAQLNIGSGCNFTSDIVDATTGNVASTGELYRYLEDSERCSGKDLKVYFDYINKSITSQLSAIVDGEVGQ